MEVTVRKATAEDIADMKSRSTWGCGISTFDWFYDSEERCLILEGEVTVEYGNGKSVNFGAGDFVIFPKGLACIWKVSKAVKKHYVFL